MPLYQHFANPASEEKEPQSYSIGRCRFNGDTMEIHFTNYKTRITLDTLTASE